MITRSVFCPLIVAGIAFTMVGVGVTSQSSDQSPSAGPAHRDGDGRNVTRLGASSAYGEEPSTADGAATHPPIDDRANDPAVWASPPVKVLRLPDGGLQPRTIMDAMGRAHVVYMTGDPHAGNLWYTCKEPQNAAFNRPIRVNSQDGSAVAIGTIRGPQIALGRDNRVHVAWNGSSAAMPRGAKDPNGNASDPMLHARMNDEGTAFEPQRCVATSTFALDGGGSIAANADGRVFIGWHAGSADAPFDEAHRRFWVAGSTDDGQTFGPEQPAFNDALGACACCGTAGIIDSSGAVHFLYRAATGFEDRDIYWLRSTNCGESFTVRKVHPWNVSQCPVSTVSLTQAVSNAGTPGDILMAWETQGQVYFARVSPTTYESSPPVAPTGEGIRRKHPAVAIDPQGWVLLAWTESPGWAQPGAAAWELFDSTNQPMAGTRQTLEGNDEVQTLNSLAVFHADGQFFVVY